MNILKKEMKFCVSCMETHEVFTIEVEEKNIFKNNEITYVATYEYCDRTDEYHESEECITKNDISMKNAYREKRGLLTSKDISGIRQKYDISQSDFALLLGWGAKTITRYEGHQVQDSAHDAIIRKINSDPEWYLELLYMAKDKFSGTAFQRYYAIASKLYEAKQDDYLRKSIQASYARYEELEEFNGGRRLDLDKVVDVIRYFSNSPQVQFLYKVKLMKLLWYADALSYKTIGKAITGLVYKALPMGAVPVAYDSIIDLRGINYEEVDFDEGTGYHFVSDNNNEYLNLTEEDKNILDRVICCFGTTRKKSIVEKMHQEQAYVQTTLRDVISYKYSKELSISM